MQKKKHLLNIIDGQMIIKIPNKSFQPTANASAEFRHYMSTEKVE
jgi:hypothetical protein